MSSTPLAPIIEGQTERIAPRAHPARGGMLLASGFAATAGLNYVFGVGLAWLIGPEEFGRIAVLQAVLLLGAMALNSGFPWTLARAMSRAGSDAHGVRPVFRSAFIGNLVLGLGLAAALLLVHRAPALGMTADMSSVMVIAAATLPLFAVNAVARGALHGSMRFARLALVRTGEVGLKVVVGLALAITLGLGAEAVAVGFLAGAVVVAILAVYFLRDLIPGPGPLAAATVYAGTVPVFVGSVGFAALMALDILVLGALLPATATAAAAVGLYQVGAMVARLPYFGGDAIVDAVFPYVASRHDSPRDSHRYLAAAVRWIVLLVVPLELFLAVRPEPILELVFPASYHDAAPLLRLLAVGSLGALAMTVFGKSLQALGRSGLTAGAVMVALVIELALLLSLVPALGAPGAAVAFAAGSWAGAAVAAFGYYRYQGVRPPSSALVVRHGVALTAALPFVLAADGPFPTWLLPVMAAAGAYLIALLALDLLRTEDARRFASAAVDLIPTRRRD